MDAAHADLPERPDEPERPATDHELTQRDHKILAFERRWWRYAGAKEQAIKDEFSLSATRYYQILNTLIDKPGALIADPMLVRRLRRLRSQRRHARSGRPRSAGA